jgi:hypothetical protein
MVYLLRLMENILMVGPIDDYLNAFVLVLSVLAAKNIGC